MLRKLAIFSTLILSGLLIIFVGLLVKAASTPLVPDDSHKNIFLLQGSTSDFTWWGTGFLLKLPSGRMLIMTNKHVCRGGENPRSQRAMGVEVAPSVIVFSRVLAVHQSSDLCALEVSPLLASTHEFYVLAPAAPKKGDTITIVGHPKHGPLKKSSGNVLDFQKDEIDALAIPHAAFGMYETDAPILPGSSGSPVFNDKGQVVGVAFATDEKESLSYIVDLAAINEFVSALEKEFPQ